MLLLVLVGRKRRWFHTDELPSSTIWPLYYPGEEKLFCSRLRYKFKLLKREIFHLAKWMDLVEHDEEDNFLCDELSMCTQAIQELKVDFHTARFLKIESLMLHLTLKKV